MFSFKSTLFAQTRFSQENVRIILSFDVFLSILKFESMRLNSVAFLTSLTTRRIFKINSK